MLSTQLNHMAEEGKLAPNCICLLKRHVTNTLKDGRYALVLNNNFLLFTSSSTFHTWLQINPLFLYLISSIIISSPRRAVVILDIEVLHPASDIPGVIGNPVAYNEGKASEHIFKYFGY